MTGPIRLPESEDALTAFWSRYRRASRQDAAELIGDRRKGFTTIASAIANLACNTAVAMSCRQRGDHPDTATIYDWAAWGCFERLPADIQARIAPKPKKPAKANPAPLPIGHPANPNK